MAANRTQYDIVGWKTDMKYFQTGKTIEIFFLEKKTFPTNAASGIEPMTFKSPSGGFHT